MKNLLFTFLLAPVFFCFTVCMQGKQEKYYVLDQSGILDSIQKEKLESLYYHHEKQTTNQVVLITTDNFHPDSTIEDYSFNKFRSLGIGQREKDNGVLIVFSAPRRRVRIATGYGTEKVLTESIAKKIIDSLMVPRFKEQKYFEGIWNGSLAICNFLEKPENKITAH